MASTRDLSNDERFSRVSKDPRFWEMPEKDKKIKIDKRFRAMFDDNKFNLKYTVDKRGRPMNHSTVQDMKRFYDLAESDESDSTEVPHSEKSQKKKKKKKKIKQTILDSTELNTSSHLNKECKNKDKVKFSECSDLDFGPQEELKSFTVTHCVRNRTLKIERGKKKDGKETSVPKSQPKASYKVAQKKEMNQNIISLFSDDQSKERREMTAVATNTNAKKYTEETKKTESESDEAAEEESSDESQCEDESMDLREEHEDDDDDVEDGDTVLEDKDRVVQTSEEDDNSDSEEEEDGEESDSGPDLARGKGNMETSSEDELDDDVAEIFPKDPEFDHAWGERDKTAPQTDEITRRLAVCNMDWDRLKAKDLLALFNSFKPKGGVIFSVKIYPSEFGKERMQNETVQGPVELKELPEDATDEQKICREKLREYQFKRLKYFYAVVECDSPETANSIYEECDGLEYESSCSFVDLRFIPDDLIFDDEPKDIATDVDFTAYTPKLFTSPAMTTAKVEITWDETDNDRLSSLNRTFKKDEILDMDFQAYLASSSEEEDDKEEEEQEDHQQQQGKAGEDSTKFKKSHNKNDDEQIAKYRELLKSIQDKDRKHEENDMEMEVTWVPGFKESAELMVRNKLEGKDSLTPWEKYLQKKKDKRKLKKKKKDYKKDEQSEDDELPPDVDLSDPFFAEEFAEPVVLKKKSKKKADMKCEASGEESDVERQKAEIALLMMDDEDDDRKHFNYEKIVEQQNLSKKKKKKLVKKQQLLEDDFEINVADTRFQSMFTSHLYNLDPSDPHYKKTKATEKLLEEKVRRREQEQAHHTEELKKPAKINEDGGKPQNIVKKSLDPALSMLIKSVKNKTEQFQARKKQKVR